MRRMPRHTSVRMSARMSARTGLSTVVSNLPQPILVCVGAARQDDDDLDYRSVHDLQPAKKKMKDLFGTLISFSATSVCGGAR